MSSLSSVITLRDGVKLPVIGLGLSHIGGYSEDAVVTALKAGYKLIDTASRYGTEKHVPAAVKKAGVDYNDIFVTTKLFPSEYGDPMAAIKRSLETLERSYVDAYLIHWPDPGTPNKKEGRAELWRSMEKIKEMGLARTIGISNYQPQHLEELEEYCSVMPTINQIELNPWQHPKDIVEHCKERDIIVQGYSPFAKGEMLSSPKLLKIAHKYAHDNGDVVTSAQLLLRWAFQHQFASIPKSTNPVRVCDNVLIFDFSISDLDMSELDSWHSNLRVTWNPEGLM